MEAEVRAVLSGRLFFNPSAGSSKGDARSVRREKKQPSV
jgi:hypothetical protein